MFSILLVCLIVVAVLMIGLILLQKSEGSGMSGSSAASMFGGALTGAAAGNFLTRATAWLATIFFILCAALALVSAKMAPEQQQSNLRSEILMQEDAGKTPAVEATVNTEAGTVEIPVETVPATESK